MQSSKVSGRLQSVLSAEIQELISIPRLSRELEPAFPRILEASAAHLVMLRERGLLEAEDARRIATALWTMKAEGASAIEVDPSLEDAYFNIEARIMHHAGRVAGGKLHLARSRNDLGATGDRMRARDLLLRLIRHGLEVAQRLVTQGVKYRGTVMTGYTHLQPAQPITFGYYLLGIASALERDLMRLVNSWDRINICPMGAGALAGTAVPIDRMRTARLLGFDEPLLHCLDAVASRDFVVEILTGLLGATTVLSRFAADLQTWSSQEFALVDFPDSVAGTSSIMPQKKNLAMLEHMKAKPAHVMAALVSFGSAVKSVYFTNTMDGNRESLRLFWEAAEEGLIGIRLGGVAASTAFPLAENMKDSASKNFSVVTDIADYLATVEALSFKDSHHVVGAVVHEALSRGMTSDQIEVDMIRRAMLKVSGRETAIGVQQLKDALDPFRSVHARDVLGGPAPSQSAETARVLTTSLDKMSDWVAQKNTHLVGSQRDLWSLVDKLARRA